MRLDGAAVEQVGGVFELAMDPSRRAVRAALLGQRQRQVELRAVGRHRLEARRQPGSSAKLTGALFWNASITWNSGCRDSDRAGLSTSTSRSNGRSWWL